VQTIQNEYSLLCRLYDTDLAELAVNENVTLLAYSPLAAGLLTGQVPGRWRAEGKPRGALAGPRRAIHAPGALSAVKAYLEIAERHGLDPVHMALAFTVQRPFPVSTIFGATTSAQLAHILEGLDVTLDAAVLEEIDATHRAMPMPY
jgi:aryl-alcohol dehydrogenase-like predicted oxidoreductase